MNEEYPEELFSCQNCKNIKEQTILLDCFHNICIECEQDNEDIMCATCPHRVTLPEEEQRIKHPLNELLIQVLHPPKEVKQIDTKCTFCEENNETKLCKECKTFWCENDLIQVHHKVIHMGMNHHLIPATDTSVLDTAPLPEGNGGADDEAVLDELIGQMEYLEERGNTNQENIQNNQNEVEHWRRSQEDKIGSIFEDIIEQIKQNKTKMLHELNGKCDEIQQNLEMNREENEKKLSVIRRGLKMLTKMRRHRAKSNSMQQFLYDRGILETNHTTSPVGLIPRANWNKLENLPKRLSREKFLANFVVHDIDFDKSGLCINYSPENNLSINNPPTPKYGHPIIHVNIFAKGNDNTPITGDIGNEIEVQIYEKSNLPTTIHYHGKPIDQGWSQGDYSAVLVINGKPKDPKYFSVRKDNNIGEALKPLTMCFIEPGLLRAVSYGGGYLYCVVKDPPQIRKYFMPKNFEMYYAASQGDEILELLPGSDSVSLEISFGQGNLATPCGICYTEDHLYVVDAGHNCIQLFTNNGDFVRKFGREGGKVGEFKRPMGIDFDRLRNDLLIADTFNHRIQVLHTITNQFTEFGSNEYFKLKEPVDIKSLRNGNGEAVVTTLGGLILLYDNARNFSKIIANGIPTPRHCCIDSEDNIYVTSHLGHCIYKLSQRKGEVGVFDKICLRTHPEFRLPTGIAINGDGKLFVTSRELNPEITKSYLSMW